jgi:hypothetical protein
MKRLEGYFEELKKCEDEDDSVRIFDIIILL